MLVHPIELDMFLSHELATETHFALNPAAPAPKSTTFAFAEINKQNKLTFSKTSETTVEDIALTTDWRRKSLGIRSPLGQGFWLNVGADYTERENIGKNSNSFLYARSPGREAYQDIGVQGGLALQLSKAIRLGSQVQVVWHKADVVGSYYVSNEDRTLYKGNMLGLTAGAAIQLDGGGGSIVYRTPTRGKVSIQGESKITSYPGIVLFTLHADVLSSWKLGIAYGLWQHDTNELRKSSTTQIRKNTYLPLGFHNENELFGLTYLQAGGQIKLTDKWHFSLYGVQETMAWQFDSAAKPEKQDNAANKLSGYGGRAQIGIQNQAILVQLGGDYFVRNSKPVPWDNLSIKHKGSDWKYYFTIQFGL